MFYWFPRDVSWFRFQVLDRGRSWRALNSMWNKTATFALFVVSCHCLLGFQNRPITSHEANPWSKNMNQLSSVIAFFSACKWSSLNQDPGIILANHCHCITFSHLVLFFLLLDKQASRQPWPWKPMLKLLGPNTMLQF